MSKDRIRDKLNQGGQYLDQLKEINQLTLNELTTDFFNLRTAERLFEIISQILIDSCGKVVSLLETETPTNYSHCFELLGRKEVITNDEATKYSNIAKLRNLIAQQYGKIDIEHLQGGLKNLETDFLQYKDKLLKWIDEDNIDI